MADQPEGVQLRVSEETVCNGANVTFNCSAADANPMELTYHLYENNVIVSNSSSTGIWNRTTPFFGDVVYRCEITNIVGTTTSADVSVRFSGRHGTLWTNRIKSTRLKTPSAISYRNVA